MARVTLPQLVQGDRLLNDAQTQIHGTLRQVAQHDQLTGQAIQSVPLSTTERAVSHGLGRTPIGWYVTDKSGAGDVYRTAWDSKTLTLRTASGSVTVDLFVW